MTGTRKLTANMLWICIDHADEITLSGKFISGMEDRVISFYDFDQLVLQADQLFDKYEFPQSFQSKRSFQDETKDLDFTASRNSFVERQEDVRLYQGKVFTGVILVESRQFSNWQGIIMNEQFQKLAGFYDVIQLLNQLLEISARKQKEKAQG